MDKRIKWLIGSLAAAFFLAFSVWFWSLGAVASEDVPTIRLEVKRPAVEIKPGDSQEWVAVETAIGVKDGDAIRTDAHGEAEIRWGDGGVTRLDPGTTIVVERIPADSSSVMNSVIKLRVETGRVWSRVLKLFGPESEFEVRTDTVVATVRGTAFGVGAVGTSTEVVVNEGVVESSPVRGGEGMFVRQGKMGVFGDNGAILLMRDLGIEDEWAEANGRLDAEFDRALAEEAAIRFQKMQKPAPEWLIELSESIHVGLAGEDAERLAGYFARRKVAAMALGRNTGFDKDRLGMLLSVSENDRLVGQVRLALHLARQPEASKRFGDSGGHRLDALEDLRSFLLDDGRYGKIDAKLIDLGEGMFRAWARGDRQYDEDLERWVNETRDELAGMKDVPDPIRYSLDRDALALLDFFSGDEVASVATTSVLDLQPTEEGGSADAEKQVEPEKRVQEKTETVLTKPTTETVAREQAPRCDAPSLSMAVNPDKGIKVGDAVALSLVGTCPDGTKLDLTAQARFNPGTPTDGKMDGRLFYPAKTGAITLYGTVEIAGKVRVATMAIGVEKQARKVTAVKVNALGPTTITTGQSVPLQALAEYSDGSTSEVTYQCRWLTSDARLAMVTNQRLQSLSGTGEVSVTCTYAEEGISVFGALMFNILLDPALQPTTSKPIQQYPGSYYLN